MRQFHKKSPYKRVLRSFSLIQIMLYEMAESVINSIVGGPDNQHAKFVKHIKFFTWLQVSCRILSNFICTKIGNRMVLGTSKKFLLSKSPKFQFMSTLGLVYYPRESKLFYNHFCHLNFLKILTTAVMKVLEIFCFYSFFIFLNFIKVLEWLETGCKNFKSFKISNL